MKLSKLFLTILLITTLIVPSNIVNATTVQTNNLLINNVNFSTWLWNTSEIVNNSDDIINFLVKNNVKVLYLQIDYSMNYAQYRKFISKATKNNIIVEALDGSPEWVSANGTALHNTFFQWLTKYQNAAPLDEQFKGVHLDVEPYLNGRYSTIPNKIITNYQNFLLSSKNSCNKLNLNLGIDIPFWFNEVSYNTIYGSGNLAEWIFQNIQFIHLISTEKPGGIPFFNKMNSYLNFFVNLDCFKLIYFSS